jgi:outer membrane protein assembly factor BamB
MKRMLLAILTTVGLGAPLCADDWPQWMGPKRDNIWREDKIVQRLSDQTVTVRWRKPVTGGYAGPAVAAGRVFVTDFDTSDNVRVDNFKRNRNQGKERVIAFDQKTGEQIWKHEYQETYAISYPAGPRCTPTVDGDHVYTLGAEGRLICFRAETGKVVWEKKLKEEYKTKSALWGYSAHPLVDGNKLICIVGGEGSHPVAFDKLTGQEIWKVGTAPEQGYSPPTIINAGGVRQLILLAPNAVRSVNPDTGKEYWSTPYNATNGSIIMSPIQSGEYLFIGGYQNKNLLLKLAADKPACEVVWKDKNNVGMSPVNVQPILHQGIVYGFHENGEMFAVELPSGKRLWKTPSPVSERAVPTGTAFIVKQGERFLFFTESGHLVSGTLTKDGFNEQSRVKLVAATNNAFGRDVVWCAPAFADRCIYVRNDKELVCFSLEAK